VDVLPNRKATWVVEEDNQTRKEKMLWKLVRKLGRSSRHQKKNHVDERYLSNIVLNPKEDIAAVTRLHLTDDLDSQQTGGRRDKNHARKRHKASVLHKRATGAA
jgi:hypothetical protein